MQEQYFESTNCKNRNIHTKLLLICMTNICFSFGISLLSSKIQWITSKPFEYVENIKIKALYKTKQKEQSKYSPKWIFIPLKLTGFYFLWTRLRRNVHTFTLKNNTQRVENRRATYFFFSLILFCFDCCCCYQYFLLRFANGRLNIVPKKKKLSSR